MSALNPSLTLPTVSTSAVEAIPVLALKSGIGIAERKAVAAALVSTLHGQITKDSQAVSTVLSILCVAMEEIIPQVKQCKTVQFNLQRVDFQYAMEVIGADGQGKRDTSKIDTPEEAHAEAALVSDLAAVYSAVALVLFACGRQAREANPDATTTNRPKALINKFSIVPEDQDILPGRPHGPSVSTLERVFTAFGVYTEPRMQVIRTLLAIQAQGEHFPRHIDAVMTQFRLMKFAGMTHVGAITKLVQSNPWTVRVPDLEPYFRIFCDNLSRFQMVPEQVRPYHRLLVPASEYLFLTSDLRPLVAVAGSFLKDVEKTFKGYVYGEADYLDLINRVKALRPGYEPTHRLNLMATQLGLEEIPALPKPQQAQIVTPEEED